jgi:hypothetical protein
MGGAAEIPKEAKELLATVRARLKTAGSWGPQEWLEELTRLRKLSVDHNLDLHKPHHNTFDIPTV